MKNSTSFTAQSLQCEIGYSQCDACLMDKLPHDSEDDNNDDFAAVTYHSTSEDDTAFRNGASEAWFAYDEVEIPFAEGRDRYLAKGVYTNGPRKGKTCVAKWYKSQSDPKLVSPTEIKNNAELFDLEIERIVQAHFLITKWNIIKPYLTPRIRVNIPDTFRIMRKGDVVRDDEKEVSSAVLVERFARHSCHKFNSNTGWWPKYFKDHEKAYKKKHWIDVMQAVSHFSYHVSNGELVVCDFTGAFFDQSSDLVLIDPVILSRSERWGATDLGSIGISTFFSQHKCNAFCQGKKWIIPDDTTCYLEVQENTFRKVLKKQ
jgi:hypothetical protein